MHIDKLLVFKPVFRYKNKITFFKLLGNDEKSTKSRRQLKLTKYYAKKFWFCTTAGFRWSGIFFCHLIFSPSLLSINKKKKIYRIRCFTRALAMAILSSFLDIKISINDPINPNWIVSKQKMNEIKNYYDDAFGHFFFFFTKHVYIIFLMTISVCSFDFCFIRRFYGMLLLQIDHSNWH